MYLLFVYKKKNCITIKYLVLQKITTKIVIMTISKETTTLCRIKSRKFIRFDRIIDRIPGGNDSKVFLLFTNPSQIRKCILVKTYNKNDFPIIFLLTYNVKWNCRNAIFKLFFHLSSNLHCWLHAFSDSAKFFWALKFGFFCVLFNLAINNSE